MPVGHPMFNFHRHALQAPNLEIRSRPRRSVFHLIVSLIILGLVAFSMAPKSAHSKSLNEYAWNFRPLIVYAPDEEVPAYKIQMSSIFEDRNALRERDMAVIEVVGDDVRTRLGPIHALDATELRALHGIEEDQFAVVLVGKDTGVKLKSFDPITSGELFALIDGMPMRRREMLGAQRP